MKKQNNNSRRVKITMGHIRTGNYTIIPSKKVAESRQRMKKYIHSTRTTNPVRKKIIRFRRWALFH